jgi:hypothetical protein
LKENLINRKQYKAVKKMDRQEMEVFLADIYKTGFEDGVDAGNKADFKIQLVEVLNNTKGIGPKLFDRILETAKEMGI